jgi:predicted phosphodiesterase
MNIRRVAPPDNGLELFITDSHQPYVDHAYWDLVNQVNRFYKPSLIWINGDGFDCYQLSKWLKDPKAAIKLQEQLDETHESYALLRKGNPNARIVWRPGNHEDRLQTYLFSKAPELAGLRSLRLEKLLRLAEIECQWIDNDVPALIGRLYHLHGHEIPIGYAHPAQKLLARVRDNVICGHVHRFDVDHDRNLSGVSHVAWTIGTGQILTPEYSFHPRWDEGFAMVEYTRKELFHVTPVEILRDKAGVAYCVVYGKLYESKAKSIKLPMYGAERD